MSGFFGRLFRKDVGEDFSEMTDEEGYVEIDTSSDDVKGNRIRVRPFVLEQFNDVKPVLDCLRDGYSICLVNIKPLKDSDMVELKRAIQKLKKTTDALDGDIAGFGEDWLAVTPSFATIHREKPAQKPQEQPLQRMQSYSNEFEEDF